MSIRKGIERLAGCAGLVLAAGMLNGAAIDATAFDPLSIDFAAVVGRAPLECGRSFEGLGTSKSSITITDFRMYLSNVRLLNTAGAETPVELTQDGVWQHGKVALLDFENATGACSNGTPDTRRVVQGTVPAGRYTGLRFDVGLPFDVNHRDPTLQPSPLNLTRMFWNWNAGYKFARIEMRTTGQPKGWMLHLGSTNCRPRNGPTSVPTECGEENRPTITLAKFDAGSQIVEFDLAALLSDSDVDVNTPETAAGCMSAATDPECGGLLRAFGLAVGAGTPAPTQRVFRAATRPSADVK